MATKTKTKKASSPKKKTFFIADLGTAYNEYHDYVVHETEQEVMEATENGQYVDRVYKVTAYEVYVPVPNPKEKFEAVFKKV